MKLKNLLPFCAVAILSACNSEPEVDTTVVPDFKEYAAETAVTTRSIAEAIEIATEARGMIDEHKSRSALSLGTDDVVVLKGLRSRTGDADTTMYVVNYPENDGFAVVSANTATEGLLAVTENGHFTTIDDIDNPGMKMFMNAATSYVAKIPPKVGGGTMVPILERTFDTVSHIIRKAEPRVKNSWGQSTPLGVYCPNKVTGCVPLAGFEALSYLELPSTFNLTYPEKTENAITVNWSAIKNAYAMNDAAKICREIGYKIDATYYEDYNGNGRQTGANPYRLQTYLKNLLGSNHVGETLTEFKDAYTSIPNKGVIIMTGEDEKTDSANVHTWIIDGYSYEYIKVDVWAREMTDGIGRPIINLRFAATNEDKIENVPL